jgi:hypothetical protein
VKKVPNNPHLMGLDGKEAKLMMQQTANDVGHVKRASFPNFIPFSALTRTCREPIEGEPS